jgi:hypothetical protein
MEVVKTWPSLDVALTLPGLRLGSMLMVKVILRN